MLAERRFGSFPKSSVVNTDSVFDALSLEESTANINSSFTHSDKQGQLPQSGPLLLLSLPLKNCRNRFPSGPKLDATQQGSVQVS